MNTTVIYYTSNGNLPLISVSQKPIDFGKNICVSIKSGHSMHGSHNYSGRAKVLPYWGTPEEVINKLL